MKKYLKFVMIILLLLIILWGIERSRQNQNLETFGLTPSSDGVEEFLALHGKSLLSEYRAGYNDDHCYNVTPQFISDQYGLTIFKFDDSCASFLLYEDVVYPLGVWFGGIGVTSFAIADLNNDKKQELYFTFSWGSGMHRSMVGFFDTASRRTSSFDYANFNQELLLKAEEGTLHVYQADCQGDSFIDIRMSSVGKAAYLNYISEGLYLVESDGKTHPAKYQENSK